MSATPTQFASSDCPKVHVNFGPPLALAEFLDAHHPAWRDESAEAQAPWLRSAVDATAATLMGFDPMSIEYLKICHERRLGVADMSKINVPPMIMAQYSKRFAHNLHY